MKKIAVITMVKNESDVIELFIQHTVRFADYILIYDHNSQDGTSIILQNLKNKYPEKIYIYKYEKVEYSQSECMTDLAFKAFNIYLADIVVPLDADEFIVTEDNDYSPYLIKEYFLKLDYTNIYKIESFNCIKENRGQYFFDTNVKYWKANKPISLGKVFFGRHFYNRYKDIVLAQGNHNLLIKKENSLNIIPSIKQYYLQINHFGLRSEIQYIKKFTLGSIANIAKFGNQTNIGRSWLQRFNKILSNQCDFNGEFDITKDYILQSFKNFICNNEITKLQGTNESYSSMDLFLLLAKLSANLSQNYFDTCQELLQYKKRNMILNKDSLSMDVALIKSLFFEYFIYKYQQQKYILYDINFLRQKNNRWIQLVVSNDKLIHYEVFISADNKINIALHMESKIYDSYYDILLQNQLLYSLDNYKPDVSCKNFTTVTFKCNILEVDTSAKLLNFLICNTINMLYEFANDDIKFNISKNVDPVG